MSHCGLKKDEISEKKGLLQQSQFKEKYTVLANFATVFNNKTLHEYTNLIIY